MKYKKEKFDPLKPAAEAYLRTGNLNSFLESSYTWMYRQVQYLQQDPDIVSDFLIYFFKKIPKHIERFQQNPIHFTAFFKKCIRYEFMNFIRCIRRREILTEDIDQYVSIQSSDDESPPANCSRIPELSRAIASMQSEHRILLRLRYGLALSLEDLSFLIQRSGIEKAARVLKQIEQRHNNTLEVKEQDVVYNEKFNCRILSQRKVGLDYPAIETLAELLSISRSSASRRIRSAISILKTHFNSEDQNGVPYNTLRNRAV